MDELQPEELEEVVQELEAGSREEEALSPEVEELLRDLQSSSTSTRMEAAPKVWIPDTGSRRTTPMDTDTLIERYDSGERSFRDISLREADLRGVDLSGSDLRGSNLYGADLREANLSRVDLRKANLYGADLRKANLCAADLREASLYGAELDGARLGEANLSGADLTGAELHGADLGSTDLTGAFLQGTGVAQEQLAQAAAADSALQQASYIDWLKDTLSGQGRNTSVRRRKPVTNFHIGLMISAGVVLLGIGIAGLTAAMPAGMSHTWQAAEFMLMVKVLSLLCLLPGIVLSGWALWNWLAPWGARNVFRRSMKETPAEVYRAWKEEHNGSKYFVTISLQAADVHGDSPDILLKLRVKRPIWESLEADMTVTARYAAENPRIALIQGEW